MVEGDILQLLKLKHTKDIFVPKCKTGPTQVGLLILDAWVLRRSWVRYSAIGYEIKVNRSDFLSDKKWIGYRSWCHEFYFVCPWKMIMPNELPEDIGLCWVTKTETRLFTKRRAIYREIDDLELLMAYILMARVKIDPPTQKGSTKEYWQRWLDERKLDYEFGRNVAKAISKEVWSLRNENMNLKMQIERIQREVTKIAI